MAIHAKSNRWDPREDITSPLPLCLGVPFKPWPESIGLQEPEPSQEATEKWKRSPLACLHLWPERPLTVTRQDRSAAPSPSDLHKYILSSSVKDKLMTAAYLLSFWLWIFLWMLWYKMGESNGDFESQTQQAACLLRQAEMRPGVRQDSSFEQFHPQVRIQSYFTKSLLKTVTHHRDREIDLVLKLPPNFHSCSLCCMQRPDFQKAGLPLQRPALAQFSKPALIST